jgi:hypothetical protein
MYNPHIGMYDYEQAACTSLSKEKSAVFLTMLRDPVGRVISEYVHVTKILDGADYAQAWDYNYTGPPNDVAAFLKCETCQVGTSNRQTRMLAGAFPTGAGTAFALSEEEEKELLRMALANLERMAYIGIMEQYEDSMLLLKRTFPDQFRQFTTYVETSHTNTCQRREPTLFNLIPFMHHHSPSSFPSFSPFKIHPVYAPMRRSFHSSLVIRRSVGANSKNEPPGPDFVRARGGTF